MNKINIELLKKILSVDVEIEEMEEFINECSKIKKYIFSPEEVISPNKISVFNKNKKNIVNFSKKYKELIDKFSECNCLEEMVSNYDLYQNWQNIYKKLLENANNVGRPKAFYLIDFLQKNGYNEFFFSDNDFTEICHEKLIKKYTNDEYEIEYYYSDGKKIYLARKEPDIYPVMFENSNILLFYKNDYKFPIVKQAIIKTFDADVKQINFLHNDRDIFFSVHDDEINTLMNICQLIINYNKQRETIHNNIYIFKHLENVAYSKEEVSHQIARLEAMYSIIKSSVDDLLRNVTEEQKKIIEESIKYLNK